MELESKKVYCYFTKINSSYFVKKEKQIILPEVPKSLNAVKETKQRLLALTNDDFIKREGQDWRLPQSIQENKHKDIYNTLT